MAWTSARHGGRQRDELRLTARRWIVDNPTAAATPAARPRRRGMAVRSGDGRGVIGVARPRVDSEAKVRGTTRYAGDMSPTGLLHARIVPSLYAHARIRGI